MKLPSALLDVRSHYLEIHLPVLALKLAPAASFSMQTLFLANVFELVLMDPMQIESPWSVWRSAPIES